MVRQVVEREVNLSSYSRKQTRIYIIGSKFIFRPYFFEQFFQAVVIKPYAQQLLKEKANFKSWY